MRPWRGGASFRTQLVALVCAVTLLGVLALTIVVQVVLARSTTRTLDTALEDRANAVISATTTGANGRLIVPDERLDAGVAVYDGGGRLVAGAPPSSESESYAALSTTTERASTDRPGPEESRILAQPFTLDGVDGVVVVTERLAPYERAELQALWVCVGAGALMVVLAGSLAVFVSRRALAPVAEMARAADDWSEHDLSHRFDLGDGRNEIAGLGRTLDGLLERVAAAIRAEQRLTSELAHELRTPLSSIVANAELALMEVTSDGLRDTLVDIAQAAARMSATIDGLLELARNESSQALARSCVLADAVAEARGPDGDGPAVEMHLDPHVRVLLPTGLTVRAIAPVLENARRLAGRVVVSVATPGEGYVEVYVDDDGPGVPTGERELIFDPGRTGGSGAGLGLALSRRVARSAGGDVFVGDGPLSTRFVIRLPGECGRGPREPGVIGP